MFTTKTPIRTQVANQVRPMALVLHRYMHRVTGFTMSAYTNPDPNLWVEVA